jgi:RNA polymerase sigma-70 factor (ECF subfamily)
MCRRELNAYPQLPREWAPEDVSQELFSRILHAAWDPEKGSLTGWLGVIIRRIVIDVLKSAYHRHTRTEGDWTSKEQDGLPSHIPPDESSGDPRDLAAQRELRERVRQAVRSLPLETRQLVTLRYIEGHTLQAISDKLAIPLATVDRRIRKVLNGLAMTLSEAGGAAEGHPGGER